MRYISVGNAAVGSYCFLSESQAVNALIIKRSERRDFCGEIARWGCLLPFERRVMGIDAVALVTGPSERPNRARMTAAADGAATVLGG